MAFQMPTVMGPILEIYGIRWPDINEDSIAELGYKIQDVSTEAYLFTLAVQRCLKALDGESESEALSALTESWREFSSGTVEPITSTVGSSASQACTLVANGILTYKSALAMRLTIEVGADALLIASGVGAAVALARKAAMRAVVMELSEIAAKQTAAWLVGLWNDQIEAHILGPLEHFASEVGASLAQPIHDIAVMAVPTRQIAIEGARVYIDHDDILKAAKALKSSINRLYDAVDSLISWRPGGGYADWTPSIPDPTVRVELEKAFDWMQEAFSKKLRATGDDIIDKIIQTIDAIYTKYVEADQELGSLARELRDTFKFPPPAPAYHIDRSTRPKPITFWQGPPEIVVTGEAVSTARLDLSVIDLPDQEEPVVTGVARSDARERIQQFVIEDAPDPVVTGHAQSDASKNLTVIDLPDLPAGQ